MLPVVCSTRAHWPARLGPAGGEGEGPGNGTSLATRTVTKPKRPDLFRVLLLNDDYTPMEFVVHVIMRFFNRTEEDATRIMLHVHHHGVGNAGSILTRSPRRR